MSTNAILAGRTAESSPTTSALAIVFVNADNGETLRQPGLLRRLIEVSYSPNDNTYRAPLIVNLSHISCHKQDKQHFTRAICSPFFRAAIIQITQN